MGIALDELREKHKQALSSRPVPAEGHGWQSLPQAIPTEQQQAALLAWIEVVPEHLPFASKVVKHFPITPLGDSDCD